MHWTLLDKISALTGEVDYIPIPREKIREAWKLMRDMKETHYLQGPPDMSRYASGMSMIIRELGIVECDGCSDTLADPGWVFKMDVTTGGDFYECEDCHGEGWVLDLEHEEPDPRGDAGECRAGGDQDEAPQPKLAGPDESETPRGEGDGHDHQRKDSEER